MSAESISPEEAAVLERIVGMIAVTKMTEGTAAALNNDPALAALANFVNGVHAAIYNPVLARRLSDAAEYMVTGNDPAPDDLFAQPFVVAEALYAEVGL